MLWFGRDNGLPEDRLGRDPVESRNIIVVAPVVEPVPVPIPVPVPVPVLAATPVPAPEAKPESAQAEPPEPAPAPAPEPELAVLPVLYVTGNKVNMRAGPSISNGVVAALVRGTAVDDLGVAAEGWSQIRVIITGQQGYMATQFLSGNQP